jgi:Cdc6-like AAA superfamily ATPase
MLNFSQGKLLAKIVGGRDDRELLYLSTGNDDMSEESSIEDLTKAVEFDGKLIPLLDIDQRTVVYIAGPSGSGKTTYAVELIKNYKRIYPKKEFFLFSRTDYRSDPAFNGLKVQQVKIDESLIEHPIDIERELVGGSILLFDDCNTIQNDKIKRQVDKLMSDIMEVGRRMDITIIITNHLVIPNERKIARTVLNEAQVLTVFPKSGSSQQIKYVLKTYFGLTAQQIDEIISLPSRWVTIYKNYPMCVIYESGAFLL